MDQIVFVFDLEQVVPLDYLVEAVEDSLIEARLNTVKQAVLRILSFCSDVGKIGASRRDLPSLGFRFYSSTEYFSLPPQLTGDWHDLSLSSWEKLEDSLVDRFDSILAAVQRAKAGQSLSGRKSPASAMCKVLEEVCALYSWDRPAIHSPVKKGKKAEHKLGNCVVIVTKLPEDLTEVDKFLGAGTKKKKPTVREVVDSLISKKVRNQFRGESNIALHILDTGESVGGEKAEAINLFNKALKEMRGGVLPVSSMSTLFNTKMETNRICSTLVCTSRSSESAPSSAVLQGHLTEVGLPSKLVDKSYVQEEIMVGEQRLCVEFKTCGIDINGMESRGFIRSTFFKAGQKWTHTVTVWSDRSPAFGAILQYLQHSGHCLLMEDRNNIMAAMFYQTDTSAVICTMDKVESHFYHMLLSLDSHTPTIALTEEIDHLLKKIATLQFSPCKKPVFIPKQINSNFDVSVLENWRLPDNPAPTVFNSLKAARAALSHQNGTYHKLMLGVRESYTTRGVIKGDKNTLNTQDASKTEPFTGKFEKKLSTLSTSSTVSLASSGNRDMNKSKGGKLNLSRGEVLRQLGERVRSSFVDTGDVKPGEIDSATFVKESVLGAKARAAADLMGKMGDPANGTDDLIDNLAALKNVVVTGTDDLVLAGYAEACVSVLLKHLDKVGVCKTSLEEVVTTKLLLDVPTVAKLYSSDPKMRVAQHKVQVLLRAEVHWLLANQSKQEQYEDSMLTHIRQISLHGGNNVMTEFLSLVLTECYIDRQPELLSLLYDELDQERPRQLSMLLSSPSGSQPPSTGPPSNFGSAGPGSQGVMAPPPVFTKPASNKANHLTRTFRSRPKSFDTSLTRQINIGVGRRERKNLKVVTTGRMITKSKLSAKKRHLPHKSPRKTKQMVKRNLTFDDGKHRSPVLPHKSPRKNLAVTTPSKARKYTPHKSKLTPGKQHRVLCPETPHHKGARRKSDGNTSIAETPDKGDGARTIASPRRQEASLALRRKASFYSGGGSRNVQKFEDSFNASLIAGNVSSLDLNSSSMDISAVRKDSVGSTGQTNNRSFVLFPHLINKKRKREDSIGGEDSDVLNSSLAEFQLRTKMPRMDAKSPVKKVKRRLNSFSDSSEPSALCPPSTVTSSQSSLRPLESTCLSGTAHVLHHHPGQELDLSSIPVGIKTPKKTQNQKTPRKNFENIEDYSSPGKKVMFNMAPQPPTPKLGLTAKSILKTPLKTECSPARQSPFLTPSRQNLGFKTPVKTPSKVAMKLSLTPKKEDPIQEPKSQVSRSMTPCKSPRTMLPSPLTTHCSSRLTPGKSPARRDIGMSSSRAILVSKEDMVKTPVKSPSGSLSNSPIIHSRRRSSVEQPNETIVVESNQEPHRARNLSDSSSKDNHGFPTPSPSAKSKKEALDKVANLLDKQVEFPQLFHGASSEDRFQPPMMSTLQNLPKLESKNPPPDQTFLPGLACTEQELNKFLPSCPPLQVTTQHINTTMAMPGINMLADTIPLAKASENVRPGTSTLEIINSSGWVDMSSTLIKPSQEVPENIFDNSALYPPPINSTVCGPLSVTNTPSKEGPIGVNQLKSPEDPYLRKIPVKLCTPVKSFNHSEHELELVSPVKRVVDNITRKLESDDEGENNQPDAVMVTENVHDEVCNQNEQAGPSKFRKTGSEHSLGACSDRTTPEPNPSSGYSSEPQPEPPSPGYMSDHSSPGKVQVSSPHKPSKGRKKTDKELKSLQDKMSSYFSPVGTRRKRKNHSEDFKANTANEEIVNETVHTTPPRNVIALHGDSPLEDEIVPSTPEIQKKDLKFCKSEENLVQAKIRIPREISGLNDLMSPFFSAGEGKRRSALRSEAVEKEKVEKRGKSKKRRQTVGFKEEAVIDKKKPRRSVRPMTYKERDDSEDSQTDEEELVRLVDKFEDEVVPEEELPEPNIDCRMTPEKVDSPVRSVNKLIDLTSPARFKCNYCNKKFKKRSRLMEHQEEELEEIQAKNAQKRKCVVCETIFKSVEELSLHARASGCKPRRLSDVTTLDLQANQEFNIGKGEKSPEASRTPKLVAELQDKLSGYYSPSTSHVRERKAPERLAEMYTNPIQTTPKSSKSSKKLFRTKTFQEALSTSTPNEIGTKSIGLKHLKGGQDQSSRRRSVRDKNISYADFPDFDSSNTEESDVTISPEERQRKPIKNFEKKKFVLASRKSPVRKFKSPEEVLLSPTHSNHSMMTLSPSVTKHFKQRKRRSLSVKNLNDSQEIQDVSSALDESQEMDTSPVVTPSKSPKSFFSPGKYFSIAKVTETPTGQIRMKLNRITKPHQPGGVTASKSGAIKRTPEKKYNFKDLLIPRLNRSACKEMGLSPNKLHSIIAESPIRGSTSVRSPEKENVPSISESCRKTLKMENQVTKTPRIRIKKVPSGEDGSDATQIWKAEPVFSPRKPCSPLKPLPHLSSPAKTFSPLTEGSIHKLTSSPIIHTQVNATNRLKKKKVNKQLAYQ